MTRRRRERERERGWNTSHILNCHLCDAIEHRLAVIIAQANRCLFFFFLFSDTISYDPVLDQVFCKSLTKRPAVMSSDISTTFWEIISFKSSRLLFLITEPVSLKEILPSWTASFRRNMKWAQKIRGNYRFTSLKKKVSIAIVHYSPVQAIVTTDLI